MAAADIDWQHLIPALHASGRKAALAITGGGSGAIGELLRIPGGSRLLIEAQVPYDERALATYLGAAPEQACSAETAIRMARAARERGLALAGPGGDVVGLGATAALVSDRPRRGEHRVHIATAGVAGIAHATIVLAKGRRNRAGEEDLVARAIILWLARGCGVAAPPLGVLIDADEMLAEAVIEARDAVDHLLAGAVDRVTAQPDGQMMLAAPQPRVLMPGSFNPVHTGHLLLARIAEELSEQPLTFEMSVTNVDKPALAAETVRRRLVQFAWRSAVELTRAPTFLEKTRLFPRTTFVIGADTAERIVAPRYYGGDHDQMHGALEEIGKAGSSFLVAVRVGADGALRTMRDVAVPRRFVDLFTEIPEARFRFDTSSSELRAQGRGLDGN